MHQSAMFHGQRFFETYCPTAAGPEVTLVEIGSQNVNGSLREVCPRGLTYIGLDFAEGEGVDVVLTDPYSIPLPDNSADVVVSSSCFEHSQFFWLVFLEAMRLLKPHGLLYLNAPSNGYFHRWPVDCWRFYPDAGHAMVAWARRQGYPALLLESFVGERSAGTVAEGGMWNDFVAVFIKDAEHRNRYPNRILHRLADYSNGYLDGAEGVLRHSERGPDFSLIEAQRERLAGLDASVSALVARMSEVDDRLAGAQRLATESEMRADTLRRERDDALQAVDRMTRSSSWRLTAPYRAVRDRLRSARRAFKRSDLLYRAVTSPLMLPAYLAYNGNRHGFYKSWRRKSGFMDQMIGVQDVIRDRLSERGGAYRYVGSLGFALAYRVHQHHSVARAMIDFGRILGREGVPGVRRWLHSARPGLASPVSVGASVVSLRQAATPEQARRILVADYRIPRPDFSAGERATVGILKDLITLNFDVTFIAKDMEPAPAYEADLRQLGVEVITRDSGHGSPDKYVLDQGARFGAFYFFRVDVAEVLLAPARQAAPWARLVFHAPDLYFLREMRAATLRGDAASRHLAMHTRAREVAMMRQADHVVVVSPAEVPILQQELPNTPISVFPALYAPVTPSPRGFDDRRHVFFLGGFGHAPNVDAVRWFANEVWPLVRARLPDVEFHIVGAQAPESVMALGHLPGIHVVGFVADLDPVLQAMRVGVAPLLYGAGIKGKVAVSMGAGIPCVCTAIAAEGMGIRDAEHALVDDEPGAFADAVVSLYTQPAVWQRVSRAGQALVQERFGDAANRDSLLQVLNAARVLPLAPYLDYMNRIAPEPVPSTDVDIDVSIIVPVYNKWPLTRSCLNSVIQCSRTSAVRYEIMLADDGSSDDTCRAGEVFPSLRVVRTPSNLGFLRNCNHAARHARGRYLVLLNNDTVVLPGWLDALLQTAESDRSEERRVGKECRSRW